MIRKHKLRSVYNIIILIFTIIISSIQGFAQHETSTDQTLQINFTEPALPYTSTGWNNLSSTAAGSSIALTDRAGSTTGVNLSIQSSGFSTNASGMQTGDNSGAFPDEVMKTYFYTSSTSGVNMLVSGLNPSTTYHFTFFASNSYTNNRTAVYTIGSQSVSLNASQNVSQTVQITAVSPNADGQVVINVKRDGAASYGFLNAMVIEREGIPLIAPSNLTATAQSQNSINLSWTDNASSETGFEVERKQDGGSYQTIATVSADQTAYTDNSAQAGTTYLYRIRAIDETNNAHSAFSSEASVTTSDPVPTPTLTSFTSSGLEVTLFFVNPMAPQGPEGGFELILDGERTYENIIPRLYASEENLSLTFTLNEPGN